MLLEWPYSGGRRKTRHRQANTQCTVHCHRLLGIQLGEGGWEAGMGIGLGAGEVVTTQGRALEQEDSAEGMVGRKDWLAVFDKQ